jgi:hypothetical protein
MMAKQLTSHKGGCALTKKIAVRVQCSYSAKTASKISQLSAVTAVSKLKSFFERVR